MTKRALVTYLGDNTFQIPLIDIPNQSFSFTALDSSFDIQVRSYVSKLCFFTIKTGGSYLCINNLGRFGVNLSYNPITTLDSKRHVFLLVPKTSDVYNVTNDKLSALQFLYTQEPYYQ